MIDKIYSQNNDWENSENNYYLSVTPEIEISGVPLSIMSNIDYYNLPTEIESFRLNTENLTLENFEEFNQSFFPSTSFNDIDYLPLESSFDVSNTFSVSNNDTMYHHDDYMNVNTNVEQDSSFLSDTESSLPKINIMDTFPEEDCKLKLNFMPTMFPPFTNPYFNNANYTPPEISQEAAGDVAEGKTLSEERHELYKELSTHVPTSTNIEDINKKYKNAFEKIAGYKSENIPVDNNFKQRVDTTLVNNINEKTQKQQLLDTIASILTGQKELNDQITIETGFNLAETDIKAGMKFTPAEALYIILAANDKFKEKTEKNILTDLSKGMPATMRALGMSVFDNSKEALTININNISTSKQNDTIDVRDPRNKSALRKAYNAYTEKLANFSGKTLRNNLKEVLSYCYPSGGITQAKRNELKKIAQDLISLNKSNRKILENVIPIIENIQANSPNGQVESLFLFQTLLKDKKGLENTLTNSEFWTLGDNNEVSEDTINQLVKLLFENSNKKLSSIEKEEEKQYKDFELSPIAKSDKIKNTKNVKELENNDFAELCNVKISEGMKKFFDEMIQKLIRWDDKYKVLDEALAIIECNSTSPNQKAAHAENVYFFSNLVIAWDEKHTNDKFLDTIKHPKYELHLDKLNESLDDIIENAPESKVENTTEANANENVTVTQNSSTPANANENVTVTQNSSTPANANENVTVTQNSSTPANANENVTVTPNSSTPANANENANARRIQQIVSDALSEKVKNIKADQAEYLSNSVKGKGQKKEIDNALQENVFSKIDITKKEEAQQDELKKVFWDCIDKLIQNKIINDLHSLLYAIDQFANKRKSFRQSNLSEKEIKERNKQYKKYLGDYILYNIPENVAKLISLNFGN